MTKKKSIIEATSHRPNCDRSMNLTFRLADTDDDLQRIHALRDEVLVKERDFIPETIEVERDEHNRHFIAKRGKEVVGSVTVYLDKGKGLPIEQYFDLSRHKQGCGSAEVSRLAVIPSERRSLVPWGLKTLAYETAKKAGAKKIFIDLFRKNVNAIEAYKDMGFRVIGNASCWDNDVAVLMLDIYEDSIYEKDGDGIDFRRSVIKDLSESFEGDRDIFI